MSHLPQAAAACAAAALLASCAHMRGAPAIEPPPFGAADLTRLSSFRETGGEPLTLVKDGVAAPIVVPDDRALLRTAMLLADVIQRSTGVRPDVLRELAGQCATNSPALFLGETAAARAAGLSAPDDHPEAFRVVERGGALFFLGRVDFAVFDWCERQLGARCYGRTDDGVDELFVPERGDGLAVRAVDYDDRPVFAMRDCWPFTGELWCRFAKAGSSHAGGVSVHAPHHWHEDAALVAERPEVFAMSPDGSRAASPLLCYGGGAALEYYERRIDEHIAGIRDSGGIVDAKRRVITVSPWDAAYFCACGDCGSKMDFSLGRDGYASPVVWGFFLKNLAGWAKERHPDYTISFLPYWSMCAVPPGLDLREEGNCEAEVCVMPGLALLKDRRTRRREEGLIRRWAEVTGRRPILWHYSCWPAEYTPAPYLFGRTIRRHFDAMRGVVDGGFVCASGDRARMSLSHYVWMRCMWNPDIDVERVYDEFAKRMFGPASRPMRRLIALQERGWERQWPDGRLVDANIYGISYPRRDVDAMKSLLVRADELAADDPAARARVRRYASAFRRFFEEAEFVFGGAPCRPLPVARAAEPPKVDGALDDACWAAAEPRGMVLAQSGGRPWAATELRAVWSDGGVTFAFRCEEPAAGSLRMDCAQGAAGQDSVNVVLAAGKDGAMRNITVDVQGRITALCDDMPWPGHGLAAASRVGDGFWSAELHVPFDSLGPEWRRAFTGRGMIFGNAVRWREGDMRLPEGERAEDSRREWSRLSTRGSTLNTDRNALVPFAMERGP